jgi:beta-lactamase regulating signal transducer with metallopeptidase domain
MTTIASWLPALLVGSLKGSILLLAALGATRMMRRSSAEARHAVLAMALTAFFILPVAGAIAPSWTLPVPSSTSVIDAVNRVVPEPRGAPRAADPAPPGDASQSTPETNDGAPSPGDQRAAVAVPLRDRFDWPLVIASLWIAGTVLIVLRLLVGLVRLRVLSRRATMVTDGGWLQTAHALARRLGLTRGVTLLRGDREAVPMTWGVLSPVVWLPPAADEWPSALRRAVLSHELAHVRRRDAATQWLANAVVALHWFNPLAWITARALRAERERACDDAVLSLGIEADAYASQLLDMVRTLGSAGGPGPAMAMARRSQFEGRLLAILDRAVSRAPVGSARLMAFSMMALVLVAALAGMRGAAPPSAPAAGSTFDTVLLALPPVVYRPPTQPSLPVMRATSGARVADLAASHSSMMTGFADATGSWGAAPSFAPPSPAFNEVIADTSDRIEIDPQPSDPPPPIANAPAELIHAIQGSARSDTTLMLEIIAAAEGISSSADRVAVLERMAKRPDLEPEVVSALGSAAGRVTSSSERSRLLRALVQNQAHTIGKSRRAVLDAIGTLPLSTEQATLLIQFINRPNLSEAALADALATSERITSNSEKTRTLVAAARLRKIEGDARASYLKSARTISTDSDRSRALSALFDGPGAEPSGNAKPPAGGAT